MVRLLSGFGGYGPVVWLTPVPSVAFADAFGPELVAVFSTLIDPLLTMVLDGLPEVLMPPVLELIDPLLVIVTGSGPVEVTAVCVPPLIVPLLVTDPPGIVWGPTVVPAGIVTPALAG